MQQMPMVLRCGAAVLQDLAVAVADAAADAYLADAGVSKGGKCNLSTLIKSPKRSCERTPNGLPLFKCSAWDTLLWQMSDAAHLCSISQSFQGRTILLFPALAPCKLIPLRRSFCACQTKPLPPVNVSLTHIGVRPDCLQGCSP